MTTLAILSDIHGNAPALDAIIERVGQEADAWLCAGDIVGHLPMVNEVIERLRQIDAHCVIGNHDYSLLHNVPITNSLAGTWAIQLQRGVISQENRNYLASLQEKLELDFEGFRITLLHGAPNDTLYGKIHTVDRSLLDLLQTDILIVGNRHRPLVHVDKEKAVLNPGAVGMPVDGERRARVMLLDLPERNVRIMEVPYNMNPLFRRMYQLGYDERYFNCLKQGRWIGFNVAEKRVPVLIAGASLYGEIVAELIEQTTDKRVAGFVDDTPSKRNKMVCGYPVLGRIDSLRAITSETGVTEVAVAIGDNRSREKVAARVKAQGMRLVILVHPQSTVSASAKLAPGVIIDAQCYIGPGCVLEEGVSIWPSAHISHDSLIGRYVSIKPGVVIGGCSKVEGQMKIPLSSHWPSYTHLTEEMIKRYHK